MVATGWNTVEVTFMQVFNLSMSCTRPYAKLWIQGGVQAHFTDAKSIDRAINWTQNFVFRDVPFNALLRVDLFDQANEDTQIGTSIVQLSPGPFNPRYRPVLPAAVHLKPGIPMELELGLSRTKKSRAIPAHIFLTLVARGPKTLAVDEIEEAPRTMPLAKQVLDRHHVAAALRPGSAAMTTKKGMAPIYKKASSPEQERRWKCKQLEVRWNATWLQLFQEEIAAWASLIKVHHLQSREIIIRRQLLHEEATSIMSIAAEQIIFESRHIFSSSAMKAQQSEDTSHLWHLPCGHKKALFAMEQTMPADTVAAATEGPPSMRTTRFNMHQEQGLDAHRRFLEESLARGPGRWATHTGPSIAADQIVNPQRGHLKEMGIDGELADMMMESYSESDYLRSLLDDKKTHRPAADTVSFSAAEVPADSIAGASPMSAELSTQSIHSLDHTAQQIVEAYRRWEESKVQLAQWRN